MIEHFLYYRSRTIDSTAAHTSIHCHGRNLTRDEKSPPLLPGNVSIASGTFSGSLSRHRACDRTQGSCSHFPWFDHPKSLRKKPSLLLEPPNTISAYPRRDINRMNYKFLFQDLQMETVTSQHLDRIGQGQKQNRVTLSTPISDASPNEPSHNDRRPAGNPRLDPWQFATGKEPTQQQRRKPARWKLRTPPFLTLPRNATHPKQVASPATPHQCIEHPQNPYV